MGYRGCICTASVRKRCCVLLTYYPIHSPSLNFVQNIRCIAWKYVELREMDMLGIYNANPSNFTSNFKFFPSM